MTLELLEKETLQPPSVQTGEPTEYRVTVIQNLHDFAPLKSEWNHFLKQAGVENLCMTYGWLVTWLREFPADELLVLIVKDQTGRWVGIAPLKIDRGRHGLGQKLLRHLQFIGTQPTVYDWMKIVTLPHENESAIIQAMAATIQKKHWDVLDLQFLSERGQCEQLCKALQFNQTREAISSKTSIPYLELPTTVEDYEKARRKKTRLEVNRHCNRFAKEFGEPPKLEFQPSCEATEAILTRFVGAHIKYWSERSQKSDFQRFPNLQDFYKNMLAYSEFQAEADEPKLVFSVLKMTDYQLSYHLGFWQQNSYLSHLTNFNQGFRSYSPGTIHMDKLVFDSIAKGAQMFEFGRGDEPYKRMWTQDKKPLWNLCVCRNLKAKCLWALDNLLKKLLGKPVE